MLWTRKMKALSLVPFLLTGVLYGQSAGPMGETLEISGIQLRLGMEQDLVFQKLREKKLGLNRAEPSDSSWFLCGSPDDQECNPILGEIIFKNGRLTLVFKRWAETKSAEDLVIAMYGAAKDFESRGLSRCQLAAGERVLPGESHRYIDVICGDHLGLRIGMMKTSKTPFVAVVDQLLSASWPDRK